MKRMLISATQRDEVRVALVEGQMLYDLDIEHPGFEQKKSNIYKGRVSRIEPSLEAAFVDYGADRHGFLPFKEVAHTYFKPETKTTPDNQELPAVPAMPVEHFSKISIKDVLHEGQELIVQIDKEERGTKGAALTTFISLAGSYLVLMPNNPRVGGISRRVEGKERNDLQDLMRSLNIQDGMGIIIRTAGVGKSLEELKWDMDLLMRQWQAIESAAISRSAPFLIYQEGDAVMRAIRDYLRHDTEEILVDTQELFDKSKQYICQVRPDFINKVKLYQNKIPLFSFYQIEKQIENAYKRVVNLPSGGSIVIDHTEALISIDVNSAKSTGGSDIEETAYNTNIEAAEEIARQLRLRDIGGLIVIDFIDMSNSKHQKEVSQFLRRSLERDRARVQVGSITRFGLLEMSRQRLRSPLDRDAKVSCPRCDGQGTIRSIESLTSSVIRMIEEEAAKESTSEIQVQLPLDFATFMLNEKRIVLSEISERQKVSIVVLPNQHLETPQYKIKCLSANDVDKSGSLASYKLVETPDSVIPEKRAVSMKATEKPIVNMQAENQLINPKLVFKEGDSNLFSGIKHFFSKAFKKKNKLATSVNAKAVDEKSSEPSGSKRKYNNLKRRPTTNNKRRYRSYRRGVGYGAKDKRNSGHYSSRVSGNTSNREQHRQVSFPQDRNSKDNFSRKDLSEAPIKENSSCNTEKKIDK